MLSASSPAAAHQGGGTEQGASDAARPRPCLLGGLRKTVLLCLHPFTFLLSKLVLGKAPCCLWYPRVGPEMPLNVGGSTFWVPPHPKVSSKHGGVDRLTELELIFALAGQTRDGDPVHGPGLTFCCVPWLEALVGWSWLL